MLMLAVSVLVCAAFLVLPTSMVFGQQSGTVINLISPKSGAVGSQVTFQGTINITGGSYSISFGDKDFFNGSATGNSVSTTFTVPNLAGQTYSVTLIDVASGAKSAPQSFRIVPTGIAAIPLATLLIMGIAISISFINMVLNRALITRMIGWQEYRSMQKEMSEYNSQRMAALRAKDDKTLEKLKKKESQIQAMQTKMFKPQLILIPITFIYLIIWPVLQGYFMINGAPQPVAYIPGFGEQQFFIWYLICSFFFGTIASRIIGVTPIQ
jgi:uncharacterized membrane protein (DUF106 family)